jgi:hypothetical protein
MAPSLNASRARVVIELPDTIIHVPEQEFEGLRQAWRHARESEARGDELPAPLVEVVGLYGETHVLDMALVTRLTKWPEEAAEAFDLAHPPENNEPWRT